MHRQVEPKMNFNYVGKKIKVKCKAKQIKTLETLLKPIKFIIKC